MHTFSSSGAVVSLVLTLVGTSVGLFQFLTTESKLSETGITLVLIMFLIAFATILIALVTLSKKRTMKIRYADNIPEISQSISSFVNDYKKKNFIESTSVLTDELSRIFSKIKGEECCITVKVIYAHADKSLKTISRTSSFKGRENREKLKGEIQSFDKATSLNSDLSLIFERNRDQLGRYVYFFSNNLTDLQGYMNSRIPQDYYNQLNKRNYIPLWLRKILVDWPLPYKSTIVVPIMLMNENILTSQTGISGTICVDSKKRGFFYEKIDVAILQSVAESIHLSFLSSVKRNGIDRIKE